MGGGLMQLVAYGAQDIYLTGNPQITFFKVVYRRHTNFSMESIEQTINGTPSFGGNSTVTISRNGDLVYKVYVTNNNSSVIQGSQIVSEVELEIGGQRIDRHYQEWNDIMAELTTPGPKRVGYKNMTHCLATNSEDSVGMTQIPLRFWFCNNPGLALPLIALQYHEVKLKFNWGTEVLAGNVVDSKVTCDYIYLDTDERRRFAQVSHEYLIEQIQKQTFGGTNSEKLNFNHPVKELIWTSPAGHHTAANYGTAKLVLNGHDRFSAQEEEYFQLRQPYDYHTAIPHQNLTVGTGIPAEMITRNTGATHTNAAGINTTDCTNAQINLVTLAGAGTPITAVPDVGVAIATATTTACAFIAGNLNGASCIKPGTITQGTRLKITIHDLSVSEAGTGISQVSYEAKVRFICAQSDLAAASSGTLGPLKLGTTLDLTTLDSGQSDGINDTDLLFVLDTQLTFATLETGVDDVTISIIGNDEADTSHMRKKINVYSFAIKPEEHQPSGTCNFSRIDNAKLDFTPGTGEAAPTGAENIYAVNYNVLRIMSGMGGLAYSN